MWSYFNLGVQVNSLVKKSTLEYWGYKETMYGICHIYGTLGSTRWRVKSDYMEMASHKGGTISLGGVEPSRHHVLQKKKSRVTQTGCILLWDFGEQKGGGLKVIIWRWQATKGEPSFRGELTPLDTMSYKKKLELHKQGAYFTSAYQFLDF